MGYDFELDGTPHTVHPEYGIDETRLLIDGVAVSAELVPGMTDGEYLLEIDGAAIPVHVATRGDVHFVQLDGRVHRIEAVNALERARRAAIPTGGAENLAAPMPGTVVAVAVEAGQIVAAGDLLLTIESMKLQTAITAPHDARVEEVCVSAGANFDQGDALIRLGPVDEDAGEEDAGEESER